MAMEGFLFSFHLFFEMKAEQTEEHLVLFHFFGGRFTKWEILIDEDYLERDLFSEWCLDWFNS